MGKNHVAECAEILNKYLAFLGVFCGKCAEIWVFETGCNFSSFSFMGERFVGETS